MHVFMYVCAVPCSFIYGVSVASALHTCMLTSSASTVCLANYTLQYSSSVAVKSNTQLAVTLSAAADWPLYTVQHCEHVQFSIRSTYRQSSLIAISMCLSIFAFLLFRCNCTVVVASYLAGQLAHLHSRYIVLALHKHI
eukprot:16436-Heterococcus_DN1.PRE.1